MQVRRIVFLSCFLNRLAVADKNQSVHSARETFAVKLIRHIVCSKFSNLYGAGKYGAGGGGQVQIGFRVAIQKEFNAVGRL